MHRYILYVYYTYNDFYFVGYILLVNAKNQLCFLNAHVGEYMALKIKIKTVIDSMMTSGFAFR